MGEHATTLVSPGAPYASRRLLMNVKGQGQTSRLIVVEDIGQSIACQTIRALKILAASARQHDSTEPVGATRKNHVSRPELLAAAGLRRRYLAPPWSIFRWLRPGL